jgi:formate hydrogenlyase subunit 6/NADH:ubiquinone oxidoreductase subunit I
MREFFIQVKQYGLKVAVDNWLIGFTKKFIGAKRITISYPEEKIWGQMKGRKNIKN